VTPGKSVDVVDWAKAAGYPSPLAGRRGSDTMAGEPPVPPLSWPDRVREPFRAAWQWIAVHVPLPAPMFATVMPGLIPRKPTTCETSFAASRSSSGFISAAGLDAGWGSTITLLCQLAGWPLLGVCVVGRKVVAHSGWRKVRAPRKHGAG